MGQPSEILMTMVLETYNEVRKRILLYAQASLSQSQFEAFRKLVLDEFGKTGAQGKVEQVFQEWNGQGGNANCCKKGDCHDI